MVGVKMEEDTKLKCLCCPVGQRDVTTHSSSYSSLSHCFKHDRILRGIQYPKKINKMIYKRLECKCKMSFKAK